MGASRVAYKTVETAEPLMRSAYQAGWNALLIELAPHLPAGFEVPHDEVMTDRYNKWSADVIGPVLRRMEKSV